MSYYVNINFSDDNIGSDMIYLLNTFHKNWTVLKTYKSTAIIGFNLETDANIAKTFFSSLKGVIDVY